MAKYRKKPVVIEAIQLRDDTRTEILATFTPNPTTPLVVVADRDGRVLYGEIDTLEGTMQVNVGDFIIRGVTGELYPCKAPIFDASYEPAE